MMAFFQNHWKSISGSAKLAAAVFIPLALLAVVRIAGFKGENSVDAYYHVALADFGPGYYTAKRIPQLAMSIWSEAFSDKELGYHLMLTGLRFLKNAVNPADAPPFNFEALFFDLLVLAAFALACLAMGIERRNLLFFTLALVIFSPFFTNRLLMLRPHNLSIALTLVACAVFHATRGRRSALAAAFVLGFVAAWCYSNPHFILLPAIAFAAAEILWKPSNDSGTDSPDDTGALQNHALKGCYCHPVDIQSSPSFGVSPEQSTSISVQTPTRFTQYLRYLPALIPVAAAAGIAAGYVAHPQFPNTFVNWKIQCVDVVWQALTGKRTIALGTEFDRPGVLWFAKNAVPYVLFICDSLIFAKLAKPRSAETTRWNALRRVDPTAAAMFAAAAAAILATPLGMRMSEYAWPLTLLSLAANLVALKRSASEPPKMFGGPKFSARLKTLIVISALAFVVFLTESYSEKKGMRPISDFASYMRQSGIPKETLIANLAWSDYPFLLYSCPEYRYLSGMDPMFSYAVAPKRVEELEKFRRGKLKLSAEKLCELTGARYFFLRKMYKRYAEKIKKTGYETLYEGLDGWLFEYNPSPTDL